MSSACAEPVALAVHVRNLRTGEAATLPSALRDTGMPYLVEDWVWVAESDGHPTPFALVVTSFCHGWLVLWRVISLSPLPPEIPLNWFMEALPQVFEQARARGCVAFLTLLADNRPAEQQMARIITRMADGTVLPFQGSMGVGLLVRAREDGTR